MIKCLTNIARKHHLWLYIYKSNHILGAFGYLSQLHTHVTNTIFAYLASGPRSTRITSPTTTRATQPEQQRIAGAAEAMASTAAAAAESAIAAHSRCGPRNRRGQSLHAAACCWRPPRRQSALRPSSAGAGRLAVCYAQSLCKGNPRNPHICQYLMPSFKFMKFRCKCVFHCLR